MFCGGKIFGKSTIFGKKKKLVKAVINQKTEDVPNEHWALSKEIFRKNIESIKWLLLAAADKQATSRKRRTQKKTGQCSGRIYIDSSREDGRGI